MMSMIKVGDYIRLKSIAFVKCFSRSTEWQDEYLSTNSFQHVSLWFSRLNCRGEAAKSFFESSVSQVVSIETDENGNPLFVTTELFWISFSKALEKEEIEILQGRPNGIKGFETDKKVLQDLEFFETECNKGLFDIQERENNKNDTYKRGFYLMNKAGKWD